MLSKRLKSARRKAPLLLVVFLPIALLVTGQVELTRAQSSYDWESAQEELGEVQQRAQKALDDLNLTIQDYEGVLAQVEADGGADPSALNAIREACAQGEALVSAGVASARSPVGVSFTAQLSAHAHSLLDASLTMQAATEAETALHVAMDAVVWNVDYHDDFLGQAADDGSVTQWEDGFFLAHRWSANGKRIASMPTYVRVNGQLYRYVSAITVPQGTMWKDIEGFVHANGGIGFETCVDGTDESAYLITHYEPI